MMRFTSQRALTFCYFFIATLAGSLAFAQVAPPPATQEQPAGKQPAKKLQKLELVDGALTLSLPADWKSVKPRNNIIKYEFAVPPMASKQEAEEEYEPGDGVVGRLTVTNASGTLHANVERWILQFKNSKGGRLSPLQPAEKGQMPKSGLEGFFVDQLKAGGVSPAFVDLRGTYNDRPRGPRGPAVELPEYRMLGLIIPTKRHGSWFVKLYGPQKTIDTVAKDFRAMAKSVNYAQ